MDYKIRKMSVEDLDQIMEIEQVSFPSPWSRHLYASELVNDFAYYLVLLVEDQVVGYAGMWLIIDEAHVTNIAIAPAFRGHRLGEYLLQAMIKVAIDYEAIGITLEVRPSNYAARRLYTRLGFVAVGLRRGYYTDTDEDAIIMWKHFPERVVENFEN